MPIGSEPRQAERVPVLPLRNSVLFPMSVVPINVGRPRSVRLVEELEAVILPSYVRIAIPVGLREEV